MRNLEVLRAVLGGQLLLSQHLGLRRQRPGPMCRACAEHSLIALATGYRCLHALTAENSDSRSTGCNWYIKKLELQANLSHCIYS